MNLIKNRLIIKITKGVKNKRLESMVLGYMHVIGNHVKQKEEEEGIIYV